MRVDAGVAAVAALGLEVAALLKVARVSLRRGGVGFLLGGGGVAVLLLLGLGLLLLRRRRRFGAGAGAGAGLGADADVAAIVSAPWKRRKVFPDGALKLLQAVAS